MAAVEEFVTVALLSGVAIAIALVLGFVGALRSLGFSRWGVSADGRTEGILGRLFAMIVGTSILLISAGAFLQPGVTRLPFAAFAEAGIIALIASASGAFAFKSIGLTIGELNWLARIYLGAYCVALVALGVEFTRSPDREALPLWLFLAGGSATILAAADEVNLGPRKVFPRVDRLGRVFLGALGLFAAAASLAMAAPKPTAPTTDVDRSPAPDSVPSSVPCGPNQSFVQGRCITTPVVTDCTNPWAPRYLEKSDILRGEQMFKLHLAGIRIPEGPRDPCQSTSRADLALCISTSRGRVCLQQSDACDRDPAASTQSVPLSGEELMSGLPVSVHRNSDGRSWTFNLRKQRILQSVLCNGGLAKGLDASQPSFTYYLEPASN